jgi:methionine-rich copper-binding protein CopC
MTSCTNPNGPIRHRVPAAGKARAVFLLAAITLAILLPAPAASAHSSLVSSVPAEGAAVATAPKQVSLEFNEPLDAGFNELVVLGPDGTSHWEDGKATVVDATISVPVKVLGPAGAYTMKYHVVSADGHPVSGSVAFTLTTAGPANARPAAVAAPPSAAIALAQTSTQDSEKTPLWPWIAGAVVLVALGVVVARRVGAGPRDSGT